MRRIMRHRREKGAVAIVVALCIMVLMASAALGVDIAKLVNERQNLRNALDAAAAAGAQMLPSRPTQAVADAKAFAAANNAGVIPTVVLKCVVGYNTSTSSPDWATVASQCGITTTTFSPSNCNTVICALPCDATKLCNTIVVSADKTVDFSFAPAIGIPTGKTGSIVSAACRGTCGTASPRPMDVVVMADRTYSMSDAYAPAGSFTSMQSGILSMFGIMTETQQFVAFGAIHKSETVNGCPTATEGDDNEPFVQIGSHVETQWRNNRWVQVTVKDYGDEFKGKWVPVPFSDSYTTGTAAAGNLAPDPSSPLVAAVNCMTIPNNGIGTHLASAMKGAARYLLGKDPNNLATLDAKGTRTNLGTPRKVIVFETDGRPEEIFDHDDASALSLDTTDDIGAQGDGEQGCRNLKTVADEAKAQGVLIIVIGFGNAARYTCKKSSYAGGDNLYNVSGATPVDDYLAAAAGSSTDPASTADKDCTTAAGRAAENADQDWYFCAADGAGLKSVFSTAMGQIDGHGKLMTLPGIN